MDDWVDGCMVTSMDKWIVEWMDGWTDGLMDRLVDGWLWLDHRMGR